MGELHFIETGGNAAFVFDHLTVEVHVWKIVRNEAGQIDTWRLVYANPQALQTWGIESLGKIEGKTTDEIFGPGSTAHYLPVVKKIIEENTAHSFQDYFENLGKTFRFTSIPAGDYFITTGDDITEFVEEKNLVEQANEELNRLVKQRTAKLLNTEEEVRILNIVEQEKEKIYSATIHGAQHILNNLLNQLKIVEFEIENHPDFDKGVIAILDQLLSEAGSLMENLSSVSKVDAQKIREAIRPANTDQQQT